MKNILHYMVMALGAFTVLTGVGLYGMKLWQGGAELEAALAVGSVVYLLVYVVVAYAKADAASVTQWNEGYRSGCDDTKNGRDIRFPD